MKIYEYVKSLRKVSELLGVSKSSIARWRLNIFRKPYSKRSSKVENPVVIEIVKMCIKTNNFITLREIKEHIFNTCNIHVSIELVRIILKKHLLFSFKKPQFYPRPSDKVVIDKTTAFINKLGNLFENKEMNSFACIDEIGFSSNVRPLKGWSAKGKPFHVHFRPSSKEKKHISCCCSVTNGGCLEYMKVEGHFNKTSFLQFLQQLNYPAKTVIILDNVRFHHSKEVLDYCKTQQWVVVHTPPYSPWFNPIEIIFKMVKQHFRKHRDIEDAFDKIDISVASSIIKSILKKLKTV